MMSTRNVPVTPDVTLWTESQGQEDHPTVLLIAGGNLSSQSWPQPFVDRLLDREVRVLRYDHRDTGKSSTSTDFHTNPYGFDDLVADALAVLDVWDVEQAHLVGMSLGHTIVQLLATAHPERVASWCALLGGALDIDFDAGLDLAMAGAHSADGLPLPTTRFLEVINLMSEPAANPEDALEQRVQKWRLLNGVDVEFDETAFREYEQRAIDHAGTTTEPFAHHLIPQPPLERARALKDVAAPLLAIQAEQDPAAPPPHAQHLADLVPNSRVVTIHDMGHAIAPHVHERLTAVICDHISAHT